MAIIFKEVGLAIAITNLETGQKKTETLNKRERGKAKEKRNIVHSSLLSCTPAKLTQKCQDRAD